jgi:hypothetical protein
MDESSSGFVPSPFEEEVSAIEEDESMDEVSPSRILPLPIEKEVSRYGSLQKLSCCILTKS